MALMAEHEAATEREREEAMLRTRGTNREDESDIGMTLAQFLSTYYRHVIIAGTFLNIF